MKNRNNMKRLTVLSKWFFSGNYDPLNLFSGGATSFFESTGNDQTEDKLGTSPTDSDSGQSTPAIDGMSLLFRNALSILWKKSSVFSYRLVPSRTVPTRDNVTYEKRGHSSHSFHGTEPERHSTSQNSPRTEEFRPHQEADERVHGAWISILNRPSDPPLIAYSLAYLPHKTTRIEGGQKSLACYQFATSSTSQIDLVVILKFGHWIDMATSRCGRKMSEERSRRRVPRCTTLTSPGFLVCYSSWVDKMVQHRLDFSFRLFLGWWE